MKAFIISAIVFFLTFTTAQSERNLKPFGQRNIPLPPPEDGDIFSASFRAAVVTNVTGTAFFDQLLDHNNPSKGTFKQQYWWNAQWWAGPGSPVINFPYFQCAGVNYHRSCFSLLENLLPLVTPAMLRTEPL